MYLHIYLVLRIHQPTVCCDNTRSINVSTLGLTSRSSSELIECFSFIHG